MVTEPELPNNMMMNTEHATPGIVTTAEGIHTLKDHTMNECYHSIHGSLQESMHVFIENGLKATHPSAQKLSILEIGFGTGLNALLTYRENLSLNKLIHYTAVEAYPLPAELISKLNFFDFIDSSLQSVFFKMHDCNWFETVSLPSEEAGNFFLFKIREDLLELKFDDHYDLVYYDAFSPVHQPELWTFEVFEKIYHACHRGAVLVTYCSKGEVKRALAKAGFIVTSLQGPKGKREMIRALKN
jgi:tRNA U34 5-methylaminomethyl-2-thiouridine-forming methyltransferase MnmC